MESELRPRLCFLTKGDRGYGFHLHGERNKGGQFIGKVVPGSSADMAGLRPGDRVVEVNGENVENETHHQVSHGSINKFLDKSCMVERIQEGHTHSEVQTMTSIPVRPLFSLPEEKEGGLLKWVSVSLV